MSKPLVDLIDCHTGIHVNAQQFLKQERSDLVRYRTRLTEVYKRNPDQPWLVCIYCLSPVQLVGQNNADQTFYFRHYPDAENAPDHQCIYKTKGKLSAEQINAIKYNGAKESEAHRTLKAQIQASLKADPDMRDIALEKVQKSKDRTAWRKPDVSAVYKDQPMVFEAQLSTTFLSVIVERKMFYEANDTFLVWVFNRFEPTDNLIRLSIQDIYFNNNSNAFVVTPKTVEASIQNKAFTMECHYIEPYLDIENVRITDRWHKQMVTLSELTFDPDTKMVFFFNYDSARKQAEADIQAIHAALDDKKQAEQAQQKQRMLEAQRNQAQSRPQPPQNAVYPTLRPSHAVIQQQHVDIEAQQQADLQAQYHQRALGHLKSRIRAEDIDANSADFVFKDPELKTLLNDVLREFEVLWRAVIEQDYNFPSRSRLVAEWAHIRQKLMLFKIDAPEAITYSPYRTLINGLLSARQGRPVGTKQANLISVAHVFIETCPQFLMHFRLTLKHYGHDNLLQDKEGKWAAKLIKHKADHIAPDRTHDRFIEFLVPAFEGRLVGQGNEQSPQ